jgi:hypothetical protein
MRTRVLRRPIVFLRVRCSFLILLIKIVRFNIVRCSIPHSIFTVKSVAFSVRYGCILLHVCSFIHFCGDFCVRLLFNVGNGAVVYDWHIELLIALEQKKGGWCLSGISKLFNSRQILYFFTIFILINFIRVLRISSDCSEQDNIIAGVCKLRLLTGRIYSNLLNRRHYSCLKPVKVVVMYRRRKTQLTGF